MGMSSSLAKILGSCSLKNVGAIDGGAAAIPSNEATPKMRLATVEIRIPIRIAPRTLRAMRVSVTAIPKSESRTGAASRAPRVINVAGSFVMIPLIWSPMKAMNRPIPIAMAFWSECGRAFMMASRTPTNERMKNSIPAMKTIPNASCQGTPEPLQRSKTK